MSPIEGFGGVGGRRRWFGSSASPESRGTPESRATEMSVDNAVLRNGVIDAQTTVDLEKGEDHVVQSDLVVSAQEGPVEFDVPPGTHVHVRVEGLSGLGDL